MSQHTVETVTPVLHRRSVISATPVEMYNAKHGNTRPVRYERGYQCATCLREYPKSKIVMVDERPYCIPFKHYLDPMHDNDLSSQ